MATPSRNISAHQRAGFTPTEAADLEAVLTSAEATVAEMLDAGDLDGAARFATAAEEFVLAAFGGTR